MATLDDVYRKFGETAEAAQLLETELGNILFLIQIEEKDLIQNQDIKIAQKIINKINKSTLGNLLRNVETKIGGKDEVILILEKALKERNRLSHSFYRDHNFRRNTVEGRIEMLKDLEKMHNRILEAYKFALALSGFDVEKLPHLLPIEHLKI